ncbi:MAG TPA: hypothetical protein VF188_17075 [Longimicrobiales bacterium]
MRRFVYQQGVAVRGNLLQPRPEQGLEDVVREVSQDECRSADRQVTERAAHESLREASQMFRICAEFRANGKPFSTWRLVAGTPEQNDPTEKVGEANLRGTDVPIPEAPERRAIAADGVREAADGTDRPCAPACDRECRAEGEWKIVAVVERRGDCIQRSRDAGASYGGPEGFLDFRYPDDRIHVDRGEVPGVGGVG